MKKILTLAFALIASPAMFAQTFTYTGAPDPIPDDDVANPLCTTVNVTGGIVSSTSLVSIDFAITHTWVGDLDITLESPAGTVVALRDRAAINGGGFGDGSSLDAATPLLFSDTALVPIADIGISCPATTAIIGLDPLCPDTEYTPSAPLSGFNAETATGTWILCVGDGGAGDTGDLRSWSLVGDGTLPVELQNFSID